MWAHGARSYDRALRAKTSVAFGWRLVRPMEHDVRILSQQCYNDRRSLLIGSGRERRIRCKFGFLPIDHKRWEQSLKSLFVDLKSCPGRYVACGAAWSLDRYCVLHSPARHRRRPHHRRCYHPGNRLALALLDRQRLLRSLDPDWLHHVQRDVCSYPACPPSQKNPFHHRPAGVCRVRESHPSTPKETLDQHHPSLTSPLHPARAAGYGYLHGL